MSEKKIVIIGWTGMLGRPVLERLSERGYHVTALSRTNKGEGLGLRNVEFVMGDFRDADTLNRALSGAYGVHINLSGQAEEHAGEIIACAKRNNVTMVTYISGITVNQSNTYYHQTRIKLNNEQNIMSSGLNYVIFKPTWFIESLAMFVNKARAAYFGNQTTFIPFVSAADYANMVLQAYSGELKPNASYEVKGRSQLNFHDALSRYVEVYHSNIKTVSTIPFFFGKFLALVSGNKTLRDVVLFMAYFEKAINTESFKALPALVGKLSFQEGLMVMKEAARPKTGT